MPTKTSLVTAPSVYVHVHSLRTQVQNLPARARCADEMLNYLTHVVKPHSHNVSLEQLRLYANTNWSYECQQVLERELHRAQRAQRRKR